MKKFLCSHFFWKTWSESARVGLGACEATKIQAQVRLRAQRRDAAALAAKAKAGPVLDFSPRIPGVWRGTWRADEGENAMHFFVFSLVRIAGATRKNRRCRNFTRQAEFDSDNLQFWQNTDTGSYSHSKSPRHQDAMPPNEGCPPIATNIPQPHRMQPRARLQPSPPACFLSK